MFSNPWITEYEADLKCYRHEKIDLWKLFCTQVVPSPAKYNHSHFAQTRGNILWYLQRYH